MSECTAKDLAGEVLRQKKILAQTLLANEVSASESEPLNTLIPKINTVARLSDVVYGERTLLSSAETFDITGIPFEPSRIAVTCEKALVNEMTSVTDYVYIALLSLDMESSDLISGQLSSGSGLQITGQITRSSIAAVTEADGTYTVSLSFDGLNLQRSVPLAFAPFYTYTWAIS